MANLRVKSIPLRANEPKIVGPRGAVRRQRRELADKTAIVTGSTSGIGLGIARAFAAVGMNVMINGFGHASEIESTRAELETAFNVKAVYSAADMSEPAEITAMVDEARNVFGQVDVLVNNAGIQHVEAIETFPAAKWDAIIAIRPLLCLPRHSCRRAGDEGEAVGPHHQHRLGPRPRRLAFQIGVRGRQARAPWANQDRRARDRGAWHHGECHLPGLCTDAARGEADPGDR